MAIIVSAASTEASGTSSSTYWWLEDPDDHAADIRLRMNGEEMEWRTPLQQGIFAPKGATRKVVISRALLGKETTIRFAIEGETGLSAWETLLGRLKTLLLRSPMVGRQWWVQVVGEPTEILDLLDVEGAPLRVIEADVIEVEEPDWPTNVDTTDYYGGGY